MSCFSYQSNLDLTLLLKAIDFRFPFHCLLKTHSKGLDLLQIFCILNCLIETLVLYSLVPKNWLGLDVLVSKILKETSEL